MPVSTVTCGLATRLWYQSGCLGPPPAEPTTSTRPAVALRAQPDTQLVLGSRPTGQSPVKDKRSKGNVGVEAVVVAQGWGGAEHLGAEYPGAAVGVRMRGAGEDVVDSAVVVGLGDEGVDFLGREGIVGGPGVAGAAIAG